MTMYVITMPANWHQVITTEYGVDTSCLKLIITRLITIRHGLSQTCLRNS